MDSIVGLECGIWPLPKGKPWNEANPPNMDVAALNETEGIPCDWVPNWKNPVPKALVWAFPLVDGMEVDPTKDVLVKDPNKEAEGMEIVPPPCTDVGVCIVVALVVEAMLLVVVIDGKRVA